jgi:threonine/homoserine/homoserine lactone efflux protein
MSELANLILFGISAGLALAIPVGPMALMLVETTLRSGHRAGAAGALAMSTVDAAYAVVVFLAGTRVSNILGKNGILLSLIGAAILLTLGIQTLTKALRTTQDYAIAESENCSQAANPLKTFFKFAAATIINPPTALYFLAIAPSLAGLTGSNPGLATLAFAGGVFIGSGVWQQTLALVGVGIRNLSSPKLRGIISLIGGSMIVALAISLALRAFLA